MNRDETTKSPGRCREELVPTFNFYWGETEGVVDESHLTVELSDVAQLSDDPGGGVYVFCSTR